MFRSQNRPQLDSFELWLPAVAYFTASHAFVSEQATLLKSQTLAFCDKLGLSSNSGWTWNARWRTKSEIMRKSGECNSKQRT